MSTARVEGLRAPDRELSVLSVLISPQPDSIVALPVPVLQLDLDGVRGDRHHGASCAADSRLARFYPRGTEVRNRRQVTLVAVEELTEVARRLDVPEVRPEWLGANLLVEGVPQLSALPHGTRLLFPSGAGLVCEGVNQPCRLPAQVLAEQYPGSDVGSRFVKAAYGLRGIAASVECGGRISSHDRARYVLPKRHPDTDRLFG